MSSAPQRASSVRPLRRSPAEPPNRIVLRCPDLTLKGRNRKEFEGALLGNLRRRLGAAGLSWPVSYARGRAYIDVADPTRLEEALQLAGEVAGVDSLAAALWLRPKATGQAEGRLVGGRVEQAVVALAAERYAPGRSFAVRVNRVDKHFRTSSQELETRLGRLILENTPFERVDLESPDRTFLLDIYPDGIYLCADRSPGFGGLPVGTGGHVLAALSGGIDSPVAAFQMAKRGCTVDLVHLTASHAQLGQDASPISRLAARISRFTLESRLICVPATRFELALGRPGTGFEATLFRRFLARVAERLAGTLGAGALVMGDSLGQVASQTLENLVCVSEAVEVPILRPLVAFNKQEIIALARELGTYGASIEPYKDCCALHSESPRTRARPSVLRRLEEDLELASEGMISAVLEDAVCRSYECGEARGGWLPFRAPSHRRG